MKKNNLSIKEWAIDDRPREKIINKGVNALSDAELIAILIGSGNKEDSAVEVAKKVLKSINNSLHNLGKLNLKQLTKTKGIGNAKAITIIAAMELGRRRKVADIEQKPVINSSKDAYDIIKSNLIDLSHEEFWVLYLNRSNKVIEKYKLSRGGVSGTITDNKLILKKALENLASSIIIIHNHPSGNSKPSNSDKEITMKLKSAAELMEIKLLDHLIITDNTYLSFVDEGLL